MSCTLKSDCLLTGVAYHGTSFETKPKSIFFTLNICLTLII